MTTELSFTFVVLCVVASALAAPKPIGDFVTPCSLKDPKLDECMLAKAREILPKIAPGVKGWLLPCLDPLYVTKMELQKSGNSAVNLALSGVNITFVGYKDSQIESVRADPKTLHFEIMFMIPHMNGTGQYRMDGRILVLPISGTGSAEWIHEQQHVKLDLDFKRVETNGKTYMKLDKVYYEILGIAKSNTQFENLFNNKQLSDNMNSIMNANSKAVFKELKTRMELTLSDLIMAVLGPMFDRIPINEIFNDVE